MMVLCQDFFQLFRDFSLSVSFSPEYALFVSLYSIFLITLYIGFSVYYLVLEGYVLLLWYCTSYSYLPSHKNSSIFPVSTGPHPIYSFVY